MEKITQTKIAAWLGISHSRISEVRNEVAGRGTLSKPTALRLAEITGIPVATLLFESGEKLYLKLKMSYLAHKGG
jgi:plasmid maintenance system antidote protein VapI